MKAIILTDPLSKFSEEGFRDQEYKWKDLPDFEWEYVTDYNHMNMDEPARFNEKLEKEGPEGWIKMSPELKEKLADAELLLTSFCGVTEEMLEAAPNLKLVYIMRSGVENCNVEAAKKRGIIVCNTPSRLAEPVADLTVALMLVEARGILRGNRSLLEGKWEKNDIYQDSTNAAFCNLRVGLYGFGAIGRAVAKRLRKGFGAEVVAYDAYVPAERIEAEDVRAVSLEEMLSTSDIISMHLQLTDSTRNIVGAKDFAMMKPNAVFVNTARAGLVDQQALLDALQTKKIRGAALDVFWDEPVPADSPFLKMDNVSMTPHRAGMTLDMVKNTMNMTVAELKRYFAGEKLLFQVK